MISLWIALLLSEYDLAMPFFIALKFGKKLRDICTMKGLNCYAPDWVPGGTKKSYTQTQVIDGFFVSGGPCDFQLLPFFRIAVGGSGLITSVSRILSEPSAALFFVSHFIPRPALLFLFSFSAVLLSLSRPFLFALLLLMSLCIVERSRKCHHANQLY